MWEIDRHFRVKVAGCYSTNCDRLISYDKEPLLTLKRQEDGYLEVDFDVFDKQGKQVAAIRQGQVISGNKQRFDVYRVADRF